jgi:hypothetical protein
MFTGRKEKASRLQAMSLGEVDIEKKIPFCSQIILSEFSKDCIC